MKRQYKVITRLVIEDLFEEIDKLEADKWDLINIETLMDSFTNDQSFRAYLKRIKSELSDKTPDARTGVRQ